MKTFNKPKKDLFILSIITLLILLGIMIRFTGIISDHNQAASPLETFMPR